MTTALRNKPGISSLRFGPPRAGELLTNCIVVYRGQDGNIDYDNPVAVMDLDDIQAAIADQDLPPNTIWHYIRRRVSDCGIESKDSPVCFVRMDANGEMQLEMPNRPLMVIVKPISGGRFLLRWRYTPIDEEVKPTEFRIYIDTGALTLTRMRNKPGIESLRFGTLHSETIPGGFDFNLPETIVKYGLGGRGEFQWTSDAYIHGTRCKFCIRAYAANKGETQNTDYVSAIADHEGPDAITDIYSTVEQLT
jgi:hypothetical protein